MIINLILNGLCPLKYNNFKLYWTCRHIKEDTNRIEEMADTFWVSKSIKTFDLYMADLYNALSAGEVLIINYYVEAEY